MAVPKKQDTTSHNLGLFKTESGQENVTNSADFRREYMENSDTAGRMPQETAKTGV